MKHQKTVLGFVGAVCIVGIMALLALPGMLARSLQQQSQGDLNFEGNTTLRILPDFGLLASNVRFSKTLGELKLNLQAETAFVHLSVWQILSGSFHPQNVIFNKANIVVGQNDDAKIALDQEASAAFNVEIRDSNFTYGRLTFSNLEAVAKCVASGEIEISGTFFEANKAGNFVANLADLRRLGGDGSPFDGSIIHDGRALSLSGQLKFSDGLTFNGRGESNFGQNLKVSGALSFNEKEMLWPDATVSVLGIDGQGEVDVKLGSARPVVNARLRAAAINVSNFDALWSETKIADFGLTGGIEVAIEDLTLGAFHLGQTTINAQGADNSIEIVSASTSGITGTASLKTGAMAASLTTKLAGKNVALNVLSLDMFAGGTSDFSAALQAHGNSPAELIANLAGEAIVRAESVKVLNADMTSLVGKVSAEVFIGWPKAENQVLDVRDAGASFVIQDGIAQTKNIKSDGAAHSLSGSGEIDFLRRAIDFKIDPVLKTGEKTKLRLPVEVIVAGPWAAPQFQPDIEGVITDPATAFATLKAEGLVSAAEKRRPKKFVDQLQAN